MAERTDDGKVRASLPRELYNDRQPHLVKEFDYVKDLIDKKLSAEWLALRQEIEAANKDDSFINRINPFSKKGKQIPHLEEYINSKDGEKLAEEFFKTLPNLRVIIDPSTYDRKEEERLFKRYKTHHKWKVAKWLVGTVISAASKR